MTALRTVQELCNTKEPIIMGIINATPDSFYDSGLSLQEDYLRSQIEHCNTYQVGIIDIGAESTQPGASPISAAEEIDRLTPILTMVKATTASLISIDTYKPEVAEFALKNGAHIINDISGGDSAELLEIVATYNAGIILMHKQGNPNTMQDNPTYPNVVDTVYTYLSNQIQTARQAGITDIVIDPGIGFGKTLDHNLALLKQLSVFKDLGCPILIGTSNKRFIQDITGASTQERLPGSLASVIAGYQHGAHIFRVHNIKETIQALDVYRAIHA
jgi:dihydropteroate synthase